MLLQLEISNIALIEHVCIDFEAGLNVLTGETGAGKSIIIDSINAVLGGRTTRELIRTGCDSASVSAVYSYFSNTIEQLFDENGITPEEDDTIIISREFSAQGRNICRVNGKVVPLSFLKQIGALLVDIHGQHDNQSLLNISKHVELLDSFGGSELSGLKKIYQDIISEYRSQKVVLNKLLSDAKERSAKLDLLEYQIKDIKQAKLKVREDEDLLARKNILSSAEKIKLNLSAAYDKLYDAPEGQISSYDSLGDAIQEISSLSKIDERYGSLAGKAEELSYQLYDIIEEIRREKENIDFEPGEIEEIEDRISLINDLKRKYGKSINDILEYLRNAEEEYNKLFNFEESTKHLEEDIKHLSDKLYESAAGITAVRNTAAKVLEDGIIEHFTDLEMKNSKFKVSVIEAEEFLQDGRDTVEFLVSTNLGEPLKPLARIASGGEMSRIMLAIKAILAKADSIPTLIFDEIDIGISGTAAARVGEKMAMLSVSHQILCVTHIARIAACANNNILIEKSVTGNSTQTYVKKLKGEDLVLEIARLLDGSNYSETTKRHAREMLGLFA